MKRITFIFSLFLFMVYHGAAAELTGFKVNRMKNPKGIERTAQFSWQIVCEEPGVYQEAYAIRVAGSERGLRDENLLYWDSERVRSAECVQVAYEGIRLPSNSDVYWQVEVWLSNGEQLKSDVQKFQTGLRYKDWTAQWIGINDLKDVKVRGDEEHRDLPARYVRQEFYVDAKVKRAMLYISGMGFSAGYINGQPVTDDVLGTLQTDYTKRVYYNTYDVTALVSKGNNAIGVLLGNGYALGLGNKDVFYGVPALRAQLVIETMTGKMVVATDEKWRATNKGPIRQNHLYYGEHYDAQFNMDGWATAQYDDSNWQKADVLPAPQGEFVYQPCFGKRTQDVLKPVSIRKTGERKYIVDMGRNMVGQLRVTLQGKSGQPVAIRHAEKLDPKNENELYVPNLRFAKSSNTYVPAEDGVFTYQPTLVYQGFRYVEISGAVSEPKLADMEGLVQYDLMAQAGSFECDNEQLNQIYKNAFWSIRGSYQGTPTGCLLSEERMDTVGGNQTGCYGENFLFDNAPLYYKWLQDMVDTQKENGQICDVASAYTPKYTNNVTRTGAIVYATYMLYTRHGDYDAMQKYYPALRQWIRYCMETTKRDSTVFSDCLRMMSEMAQKLGLNADVLEYKKIVANLKSAHNAQSSNPMDVNTVLQRSHPDSSNNVPLLGDLLIWYYEDLAGIRQSEGSVGYKKMLMKSTFPEELNHVKASYECPYGPIRSEWKKDGNQLMWHIEIPANTTAQVRIPVRFNVRSQKGNGVYSVDAEGDETVINIGSGKYIFGSAVE